MSMLDHGSALCDTSPAQVMLELKKELKKRRDSKGPVSEEEEISAWGRAGAFAHVPCGIRLVTAVMLVAVHPALRYVRFVCCRCKLGSPGTSDTSSAHTTCCNTC